MDLNLAIQAFNSAFEALKFGIEQRDKAKIDAALKETNEKYINLQNMVISTQSLISQAKDELQLAKEECVQLKKIAAERETYLLHEIKTGVFVYKTREGVEPSHYLCQNCYDKGIKSILRFTPKSQYGEALYSCVENQHHIIFMM